MRLRPLTVLGLVALCLAPLAAASPAVAAAAQFSIRGTVLLDGRPADGASVQLVSAGVGARGCPGADDGSGAIRTGSDGGFTLQGSASSIPKAGLIQACAGTPQAEAFVGAAGGGAIETVEAPEATRPLNADLIASLSNPLVVELHSPGRIRIEGLDPHGTETGVQLLTRTGTRLGQPLDCERKAVCESEALPPGAYRIRAKPSDESGTWTSDWFQVVPGGIARLTVPARGLVSGRIHVAGGSKGQRYAVAAWPAGGQRDWDVPARRDGTYRLPALLPGRWTLSVLSTDTTGRHGVVSNETTVVVKPGERLDHDFHLRAGTTLSGRMTGLTRQPLDWQAQAMLLRGSEVVAYGGASSRTGSTGDLLIPGAPRGAYTLLTVSGTRMSIRRITITGAATQRIPGTVTATGRTLRVHGRVDGVRSGSVSFISLDGGPGFFGTITGGRYTATGGVPGRYRVAVRADLHLTSSTTVTITRDATRNLRPGAAYTKVTGRIADGVGLLPTGFVVPGDTTRVTVRPARTGPTPEYPMIDSHGRFATYLAPGTYSTDFFTASRRKENANEYSAYNPYGLVPVTPTTFTVQAGKALDLGTITTRLVG